MKYWIIKIFTQPPRPLASRWALLHAIFLSPFTWLGWVWKTSWKIIFTIADGKVPNAQAPRMPIQMPLTPVDLFQGTTPYEVYKHTRERLWNEVNLRRARLWTLTTWSAGLITVIIGGLLAFAADGKELKPFVLHAVMVWVGFIALFSIVRILHDNIISDYHNNACQMMDHKFGLHFDDSSHKIDMKLHHFFMAIIFLLTAGALVLASKYEGIKTPTDGTKSSSCCCEPHDKNSADDTHSFKALVDEMRATLASPRGVDDTFRQVMETQRTVPSDQVIDKVSPPSQDELKAMPPPTTPAPKLQPK